MSTLDMLSTKDGVADALRQLTGRGDPPGYPLASIGIFAAGLFAGAALMALFAPKPGAELRQDIAARVGDLRHTLPKTEEEVASDL